MAKEIGAGEVTFQPDMTDRNPNNLFLKPYPSLAAEALRMAASSSYIFLA